MILNYFLLKQRIKPLLLASCKLLSKRIKVSLKLPKQLSLTISVKKQLALVHVVVLLVLTQ